MYRGFDFLNFKMLGVNMIRYDTNEKI